MPDRYRNYFIGLGIIVALLAFFATIHVSQYIHQQAQQREEAADYQIRDPNRVLECADDHGWSSKALCFLKVVGTQQEHDRDYHDLEAQQNMAAWALALLWVAGISAIISGVGIWLVLSNLVALEDQTRTTKLLSQKSTKAYLSAEKCQILWPKAKEATFVIFTFANSGQSPALNIRVALYTKHRHENRPDWSRSEDASGSGAVAGNDSGDFKFSLNLTNFFDQVVRWEDGALIGLPIHGAVFYEDIYGRLHRSCFHFLIECVANGEDDPRSPGALFELPKFGVNNHLFEEAPEKYQKT